MFRPRPCLWQPLVVAPPKDGYVQAAVQFIIPGLAVGQGTQAVLKLFKHLGSQIYDGAIKKVTANDTKQEGTLVTVAFYVPQASDHETLMATVDDAAIEIVERFLGMLSFLAGVRLVAIYTQTTTVEDSGSLSTKLEPLGRADHTKLPFSLPANPFDGRTPTDNVFIALFWLRRALAERDPLDTYAALMVSLQAIERELVQSKPVERRCSKCGNVTIEHAGVTAMVRELVVEKLGASPEQFNSFWRVRNAVVAHGNQSVSAGTFLQLTELKFEAARLCYKGIKLAMGLPPDGPPHIDPSFFVTSALMYVE